MDVASSSGSEILFPTFSAETIDKNTEIRKITVQDASQEQMSDPKLSQSQMTLPDITKSQTTIPDINQSQITLPNISLSQMTLPDINPSQNAFSETCQSQVILPDTNLSQMTLPDTNLSQLTLPDTNLSQLTLPDTNLSQLTLPDTNLSQLTLPDTNLSQLTLPDTNLSQLTLPDTNLSQLTLPDTNQSQLTLPDTNLSQVTLPLTNLSPATLTDSRKTKTVDSNFNETNFSFKESSQSRVPLTQPAGLSQTMTVPPSQMAPTTGRHKFQEIQNSQCHVTLYPGRKHSTTQGSILLTEPPDFDPYSFTEEPVVKSQQTRNAKSKHFQTKPKTVRASIVEVKKLHKIIQQQLLTKSYSNLTNLLLTSQEKLSDIKKTNSITCELLKQQGLQMNHTAKSKAILLKKINTLKIQQRTLKSLFDSHNAFCRIAKEKLNLPLCHRPKTTEIASSKTTEPPANDSLVDVGKNQSDKTSTVCSMSLPSKHVKITTENRAEIEGNKRPIVNVNTNVMDQYSIEEQHLQLNLQGMMPNQVPKISKNIVNLPTNQVNSSNPNKLNSSFIAPNSKNSLPPLSVASSEDFPQMTIPPFLARQQTSVPGESNLNSRQNKSAVKKLVSEENQRKNPLTNSSAPNELNQPQNTIFTQTPIVETLHNASSIDMSNNWKITANYSNTLRYKNRSRINSTLNISQEHAYSSRENSKSHNGIYQKDVVKVLLIEDSEFTPISDVFPSLQWSNLKDCLLPSFLFEDINEWPVK
ncbi:myb-like protein U [Octopus bimaculoides]|uniref:Uncharacterized protein n=1 Tax=Octopus bimaculoides TaxID=37653 RepID=A0A0L8G3P9_OCTBM|nr:myb-like protein U [Octopus bimaculoides]|eukprot:XP_014784383.1 PREDICTED: uncharacterized protein LOC106879372 [Octopus bimaculoides]